MFSLISRSHLSFVFEFVVWIVWVFLCVFEVVLRVGAFDLVVELPSDIELFIDIVSDDSLSASFRLR